MEFPTLKLRQALVELGYEVAVGPTSGLFYPTKNGCAFSGPLSGSETYAWRLCVYDMLTRAGR